MISFLPVASEWTGQWGASFWSGLDIVGHVLGKVRKLCGGGWIEAKKGHSASKHSLISHLVNWSMILFLCFHANNSAFS